MATIVGGAVFTPAVGLGRFASSLSLRNEKTRYVGRRGSAASATAKTTSSLSRSSQSSSTDSSLSVSSLFQERLLSGAESWQDREWSKVVAPIVASAGFHLQVLSSASAGEEVVVEVSLVSVLTLGAIAFVYFLVVPAIVYNYLRLRWYKRNTAETFFQFMLVFIFFPGMLLLAPFINFRRLPKEGTEPP